MIKILRHLKPYKLFVILSMVFVFIQTMTQLFLPTLMSDIVNVGITNGDIEYMLVVGGYMLLVALFGTVAAIIATYTSAKAGTGLSRTLRTKVFTQVESYSLYEFDQIGTASLITRTTNDITQIERVVIMILRMMLMAPMMAIGGVIMAIYQDAKLSVIMLVVVPVLILVIFLLARKVIPLFKQIQEKVDKLNLVLREGLTGIRVIRAFNRTAYEKERFHKANVDLTDISIKANKIMAGLMPLLMLVMNLTTVAIIWFGGIRIDSGGMLVGDLMAFVQYTMQIMFSLIMLSMIFVLIPRASASAGRINEVLALEPALKDQEGKEIVALEKGYIEFQDVSFSYPGAEEAAIHNISFSAKPGEVTAIIGGTGSGKSTIINLITRFYDVSKGSILVDGQDIRHIKQKTLRSKIGLVPQKAILFSGTIEENIKYGKEDATEDEIKYAIEVAQASEFVSGMKDGLNAMITQGGSNLSGGQKQRLSIARALVKRPEIYLFDDSFSALDFKTDAKLRAALNKEIDDATVILVAQRVSTIMEADRILVIDEGRLVGIGTHQELLRNNDVYKEIVASQLSEEELA
jgi:ATP-binding cassette subfamily B protein